MGNFHSVLQLLATSKCRLLYVSIPLQVNKDNEQWLSDVQLINTYILVFVCSQQFLSNPPEQSGITFFKNVRKVRKCYEFQEVFSSTLQLLLHLSHSAPQRSFIWFHRFVQLELMLVYSLDKNRRQENRHLAFWIECFLEKNITAPSNPTTEINAV